jgi:hypothetical protein
MAEPYHIETEDNQFRVAIYTAEAPVTAPLSSLSVPAAQPISFLRLPPLD